MKLMCALCMFDEKSGDDKPLTVINGILVCRKHSGYVQGGKFTAALALLKGETK
jgi:hypothetical protein